MTQKTTRKLLVVTDLDSSLLDEDYGYDGAKEAIRELKEHGFPLVPNSSKTYAELRFLAHELEQCYAVVAENGGMVAVHKESVIAPEGEADAFGYIPQSSGMSRQEILRYAHGLRASEGYQFEGFSDWSVEQVVEHTGLSTESARQAMERDTTEPILWRDTDQEWEVFMAKMQQHGVKALRGGRFIHLMGPVDKAQGMQKVTELYQQAEPTTEWVVVAVGDSANDKAMLEAADIAVVIPHADGPRVDPNNSHRIDAVQTGSKGWGEAISNIIKNF
ncbi:HAD-IIB family hydrolase [Rubritalea spongiae]|uniref:HAD-IIB family hydrolase n=1 Tax=Rubritalea spongiae TaxID=430797 RepID=A0ABW5DZV0_9BACT